MQRIKPVAHCSSRIVVALLPLLVAGELLAAPPKVNYLFPAGGQRGQSTKVAAKGDFSNWPVQVWSDHAGVSGTAESEKGNLVIKIEPDATPGVAWLRLYDAEGGSALQPFVVGTLPEIEEKEPNDLPSSPQLVAPKCVVSGRLQKNGDVDLYTLPLKRGETVVAALQANAVLGSPVDAVLQICQLHERRPLQDSSPVLEAYVLQQEHDSVGLDPRLVFTALRDGVYLLRVFGFSAEPNGNIAFAGGDNFIYRLTLTSGPYIAAALPTAVQRSQPSELKLVGWNLSAEMSRQTLPAIPASPGGLNGTCELSPIAFQNDAAGFARLNWVDHPSIIAAPDNDNEHPQSVSVPLTISGRIAQGGAAHSFVFNATKAQKLRLNIEASSLGFPWDPHLAVIDESGKVLADNDDAKKDRDPQLVFSPPADGKYRVIVRDLADSGGLAFVYQLTMEPVVPTYALTVATDSFALAADKPLEIAVSIDRRDGFAEPIAVRVIGLPPGVVAEEATSKMDGDSSKTVKLTLKTTAELQAAVSLPISIVGDSAGGSRRATFNLPQSLAGEHTAAWITVVR
jgi:hypothetical protein